ncbi:hypothetical protein J437_LFUL018729 [Ladona fulva]|uniref:Uncharacterized protein n=1 Tax=Ladona fulva TaxID=123851 RepID=A0A8K0PBQ7_LADFU|nr:hypothetical protein J437_LFUL018729 [Ladona fulva]
MTSDPCERDEPYKPSQLEGDKTKSSVYHDGIFHLRSALARYLSQISHGESALPKRPGEPRLGGSLPVYTQYHRGLSDSVLTGAVPQHCTLRYSLCLPKERREGSSGCGRPLDERSRDRKKRTRKRTKRGTEKEGKLTRPAGDTIHAWRCTSPPLKNPVRPEDDSSVAAALDKEYAKQRLRKEDATKAEIDEWLMSEWNKRWLNGTKAKVLHEIIPSVRQRETMKFEPCRQIVHFLSGMGHTTIICTVSFLYLIGETEGVRGRRFVAAASRYSGSKGVAVAGATGAWDSGGELSSWGPTLRPPASPLVRPVPSPEDRNLVWSKRANAGLIPMLSKYRDCEGTAYRSFWLGKFPARGVRIVTTGITGLWRPSVHSDVTI